MVNVAIYALSARAISLAPKGTSIDAPTLVERALPIGMTVKPFNIIEDWIDVGNVNELARARETYDPSRRPSLHTLRGGSAARGLVALTSCDVASASYARAG